jgi:DNA-binding response OmpR family regulator
VDHANNGRDGMFLAASESYDAIIMDRMLPGGIDGLGIIGALRKAENKTPILILSALSDVDERIRGLQSGGDDYLVKPFAFGELMARLDALIRRSQTNETETTLVLDDLSLDLLSRKVTRGAKTLNLKPREFKLLEYLMRHPHDAAGERLGLPLRSADERCRRAHQQAASADRRRRRASTAENHTQCRVYADCRWLDSCGSPLSVWRSPT